MISEKQLKFVLQDGEGFKIEFKESPQGVEREIVAFSNSSECGNAQGLFMFYHKKSQVSFRCHSGVISKNNREGRK